MIAIRGLSVQVGRFALEHVDLRVEEGEYFVVVGPTGAGKSVLLEAIAGLHRPRCGQILLGGTDVTWLQPEKRGIGMVYQDYALFPHLNVKDNIAFGLRAQKRDRAEIDSALEWMAGLLNVGHLLGRRPGSLSGGERQKVALARALVTRPAVLLLDEPLSALDEVSRETLQTDLLRLSRTFKTTVVHVTHDFQEATSLGDHVAVMGDGRIRQVGTPEQVFRQPNSEFVARFTMARNIFAGDAKREREGMMAFHTGDVRLISTGDKTGPCHASVRPEDVIVSDEPMRSSADNAFAGIVSRVIDRGPILYVTVSLPPEITCLVTRRSSREMQIAEGKPVHVAFAASSVHLF